MAYSYKTPEVTQEIGRIAKLFRSRIMDHSGRAGVMSYCEGVYAQYPLQAGLSQGGKRILAARHVASCVARVFNTSSALWPLGMRMAKSAATR